MRFIVAATRAASDRAPAGLNRSARRSHRVARFLAAAVVTLFLTKFAAANIITVANTNDSGAGSLRQALVDVTSGGSIDFATALNGKTITLTSGELVISKSMTVSGPGADKLVVNQATIDARVININAPVASLVSISGLTISGGNGNNNGGAGIRSGAAASMTLNLASVEVVGNEVTNGDGGGILTMNGSPVNVTTSTIAENSASGSGGGVFFTGAGTFVNSTISGNTASSSGGAALLSDNGNVGVKFTSCTITNNRSDGGNDSGAGIMLQPSTSSLTLTNTIVAGDEPELAGDIVGAPQLGSSFNFIGTNEGLTGLAGGTNHNAIGVLQFPNVPRLRPLDYNGGSTRTHLPLSISFVIDAGHQSGAAVTDQRGFTRTKDLTLANKNGSDGTDIGAVEVQDLRGVQNANDSGAGSLRQALTDVASGGLIVFNTAANGQTIGLTSGELAVSKTVAILGPGAANVIIAQQTPDNRVIDVTAGAGNGVTIAGLRIMGGNGANTGGGGVMNANGASLRLSQVQIDSNTSNGGGGGGVFNKSGRLNIDNSSIVTNTAASSGGGVRYGGGSGSIENSTIANNTGTIGGGIRLIATTSPGVIISNCTIAHNSATAGNPGAGLSLPSSGARVVLFNTIVAANLPASAGDIDGPPQPMSTFNLVGNNTHLTGGTIVNGTSGNQVGTAAQPIDPKLSLVEDNGGGFQTCLPLKGSPAIDAGAASNLSQDQRGFFRSIDLPDVANAAASNGTDIGALELQPPVVTNNADSGVGSLRLAINDAFDGTTIAVPFTVVDLQSQLVIRQSLTITGPGADKFTLLQIAKDRVMTVLTPTGGEVTLSRMRITGGNLDSALAGGGILSTGGSTLTLSSVQLDGNTTKGAAGGIEVLTGNLVIDQSTINGNTASQSGGAIGLGNGASCLMRNSTIEGNHADIGGGAMRLFNSASATLKNCTVTHNSVNSTGGAGLSVISSSTITLLSTIVAGNTPGGAGDVAGSPDSSSSFNLIGNDNALTGGTLVNGANGNQVGTGAHRIDPKLSPLQQNGGPLPTCLLLVGSPALDAGLNATGSNIDQRGLPRPVDQAVANASGSDGSDIGAIEVQNAVVTNTNDDGVGSLRLALNDSFDGAQLTVPSTIGSAIDLTTGELEIRHPLQLLGPGADKLTVTQTTPEKRVFSVDLATGKTAVIAGIRITGGATFDPFGGGGVVLTGAGTLNLFNVDIDNNHSDVAGGGVADQGGQLFIVSSTIENNSAHDGGGGVFYGANTHGQVINSTFTGNTSVAAGGAIALGQNAAPISITTSTIAANDVTGASVNGAGIEIGTGAGLSLLDCIVANNTPTTAGEIHGSPNSAAFNVIGNSTGLSGIVLLNGKAGNHVGAPGQPLDPKLELIDIDPMPYFRLLAGSPALDAGADSGTNADQRGFPRPHDLAGVPNVNGGDGTDIGAVEMQDPTVVNNGDSGFGSFRQALIEALEGATVSFSPALNGATINLASPIRIASGLTIAGPGARQLTINQAATNTDGEIFEVQATTKVTIAGIKLTGGHNLDDGGAIKHEASGTLTLSAVEITGNSSTGDGGGVWNQDGKLEIVNSTIAGNSAGKRGGAVEYTNGFGPITNSTISGNTAAKGGGISSNNNSGDGVVSISNSTIANNTATSTGSGGGIDINSHSGAIVSLVSSIVAGNHAAGAGDVTGAPQSSSRFNLIGIDTGLTGGTLTDGTNNNHVGTAAKAIDPLLAALTNNGGPTRTHGLNPGSPAIDAGANPLGLATDQRGLARTVDDPSVSKLTQVRSAVAAATAAGDVTDIGALELQSTPIPTPTSTPKNTPTPTPTSTPKNTPTPTPTPTPTSAADKLLNISTRMEVLTGENVLIGGFIITGTGTKKVLIRGLGPELPVAAQLQNPVLELHQGATVIASNDNWRDRQEQEIKDTTIPPTDDRESSIVQTLQPGGYTAILSGKDAGTGVGQVEVYDLTAATASQVANISTRGFVDVGDNVMIGGVIIGGGTGNTTTHVLVRAIGPSLGGQGVGNALQDPTLELHDVNGVLLAQNDDWKATQEAAIEATTVPPSDDRESAIVQTLAAGKYTAIVRGKNGATGVGLVELFNLQ